MESIGLSGSDPLSGRRRRLWFRRLVGTELSRGAAWGAVILICGWLLACGLFGLPGA
jgi:hypothetical protein